MLPLLNNQIYQLLLFRQTLAMKYLAAYALLSLSGKKDITSKDIEKVLGTAEVSCEDADINRLLESVKGRKIEDLIAEGIKKIGSSGSAATSAPAAVAVAKEAPKQAAKEAPKKVEKKKEAPPPEDDDDDFMAGGLFD